MPKTALVLYAVLLSLYGAATLYLLDCSNRYPQYWLHYQSMWLLWCVISFFILIWWWYMLRPADNPIKDSSLKWGEAYAHFCERLGPGIVAFWGAGVCYTWLLHPTEHVYLVLLGLALLTLGMQTLSLSRLTKLLWIQLSLPLAMFILLLQSWQWLMGL